MEQAQETATKIEAELKDLKATLKNIQDARPFDQLTTDEVIAARPEIGRTVEEAVKTGKRETPGYARKFGSEGCLSFSCIRRASDLTNALPPQQTSVRSKEFDRLLRACRFAKYIVCSSDWSMGKDPKMGSNQRYAE